MGEPVTPPWLERHDTHVLAMRIVRAVAEDETGPLDCPADLTNKAQAAIDLADVGNRNLLLAWAERADRTLFRLAQDLVDTRRALEIACDTLNGEDADPDGELAEKLRRLEVER